MPSNVDLSNHLVNGKGVWKYHLSNQPYKGSNDSMTNQTDVNEAVSFVPPLVHATSPQWQLTGIFRRYESFLLAPDEKKVEEKIDTRMPNTSYFNFNKEDHTLANLLRSKLLSSNHIMFAAYRVSRPSSVGLPNLTWSRFRIRYSRPLNYEYKLTERLRQKKLWLPPAKIS